MAGPDGAVETIEHFPEAIVAEMRRIEDHAETLDLRDRKEGQPVTRHQEQLFVVSEPFQHIEIQYGVIRGEDCGKALGEAGLLAPAGVKAIVGRGHASCFCAGRCAKSSGRLREVKPLNSYLS